MQLIRKDKEILAQVADFLIKDKDNQNSSNIITNLIKQGSEYVQDNEEAWMLVKNMVEKVANNERIDVVIKVKKKHK